MIFRTLLFFVVMYFLVKIISRLFLSSNNKQQGRNGASAFYRTFQQFSQQSKRQNDRNRHSANGSQRFEEIEEAEFEDVTEEEKSTSTSPE